MMKIGKARKYFIQVQSTIHTFKLSHLAKSTALASTLLQNTSATQKVTGTVTMDAPRKTTLNAVGLIALAPAPIRKLKVKVYRIGP